MRVPKYRRHTVRDFAFVERDGKRIRLPGRYNSPESRDAYRDLLATLGTVPTDEPPAVQPSEGFTVAVLVASYLDHALEYYPGGKRGEYSNMRCALAPLARMFGELPAAECGPKRIKELRRSLVQAGRSRTYINQSIARIKRAFRWAASEELIRVRVYRAIATVQGLRAGRTKAPDKPRRKPVAWSHVEPVLTEVHPIIAAMVQVQWLTGARSGSICRAQPEQFDRSDSIWLWRPRHKTEWRGVELVVPIGPKCQALLQPYIDATPPGSFLFDPRRTRPNRRYRNRYAPGSYCVAIQRAIKRINKRRLEQNETPLPLWSPHQLRHARGHEIRAKYGIEAAQAVLGHESLDATEIYTSRRTELAKQVAAEIG